MDPNDDE
jgi:hypothetical protein